MCGTDAATSPARDRHDRVSCSGGGVVYHTYSTYARGLERPLGHLPLLTARPKGRNRTGILLRRHDDTTTLSQSLWCRGAQAGRENSDAWFPSTLPASLFDVLGALLISATSAAVTIVCSTSTKSIAGSYRLPRNDV